MPYIGYVKFHDKKQVKALDLRHVTGHVTPFPKNIYKYHVTQAPKYIYPHKLSVPGHDPEASMTQVRDPKADYIFPLERSHHPDSFSRFSRPVGVFGYTELKPGFTVIAPKPR